MSDCRHERRIEGGAPVYDPWDPDVVMYYEPDKVEGTWEDIDTGRYRCTQCKEVFYYSGYWKEFHTGGKS